MPTDPPLTPARLTGTAEDVAPGVVVVEITNPGTPGIVPVPDDPARAADLKGWQALREACRKQHPRGPGGCAMCICGAGGGSSLACAMLATLRDIVRYMPTDALPPEWRERIELLRSVA